jgi:hypothetical protein
MQLFVTVYRAAGIALHQSYVYVASFYDSLWHAGTWHVMGSDSKNLPVLRVGVTYKWEVTPLLLGALEQDTGYHSAGTMCQWRWNQWRTLIGCEGVRPKRHRLSRDWRPSSGMLLPHSRKGGLFM